MNCLKVVNDSEELMDRLDSEFAIVTAITDEEDIKEYDGEFIIYDTMEVDEIKERVREIEKEMNKKKK